MSPYIGRRIIIRDAHGDWWDGFLEDVIEECAMDFFLLVLDNGDVLKLPVEDVTAILETRAKSRTTGNVIPFRKQKASSK